jgi:hypothetical protein
MSQQAGGMDMNALVQRLRRLVMLDTTVFDEVRTDANATLPAALIAVVSMLLFGIGGWLWWLFQDFPDEYISSGDVLLRSAILGSIVALVLWVVAVGITYVMLTQVFRARADLNELVRVMGFATAPLALGVLLFIPGFDFGIALIAVALTVGVSIVAVQTATDAPAGRVVASVGAGFLVWAVVLSLLVTSDASDPEMPFVPNFFFFGPTDTGL